MSLQPWTEPRVESGEFTAELDIVARFDAGDPGVTLDEYDDAIEVLDEKG